MPSLVGSEMCIRDRPYMMISTSKSDHNPVDLILSEKRESLTIELT